MAEPLTHTAGDALAWRRDDLTDYPGSGGWTLAPPPHRLHAEPRSDV